MGQSEPIEKRESQEPLPSLAQRVISTYLDTNAQELLNSITTKHKEILDKSESLGFAPLKSITLYDHRRLEYLNKIRTSAEEKFNERWEEKWNNLSTSDATLVGIITRAWHAYADSASLTDVFSRRELHNAYMTHLRNNPDANLSLSGEQFVEMMQDRLACFKAIKDAMDFELSPERFGDLVEVREMAKEIRVMYYPHEETPEGFEPRMMGKLSYVPDFIQKLVVPHVLNKSRLLITDGDSLPEMQRNLIRRFHNYAIRAIGHQLQFNSGLREQIEAVEVLEKRFANEFGAPYDDPIRQRLAKHVEKCLGGMDREYDLSTPKNPPNPKDQSE